MMKYQKRKPLAMVIAVSTLSLIHPVWAQDSGELIIEEILVTARKAQESEQDLPITIAALTGAELNNGVVFDVQGLQAAVPGLQVSTSNQAGFPIFAIRGSETQNNIDGAVGIYFGDVPVLTTTAVANAFYDIASVEVLKGPQGTQFGANSTGGTVSVRPNVPTETFEGYVKAGYGKFERTEMEGMVNIPVNDVLKFRFAGNQVKRDGYIDNPNGGGEIADEFWDEDHYSLRASMRIETEQFTSDTIVDYYDADELFYMPIPVLFTDVTGVPGSNPENFGDAVGSPDTVHIAPNLTGLDRPLNTETELWGIQHVLNFKINDNWSLRNVTGYRDDSRDASERSGPTSVHTITVLTADSNDRFVNDLTLQYEQNTLRVSVGAYYQDDNRDQGIVAAAAQNLFLAGIAEPFIPAGTPLVSNVRILREREVESKALYSNLEYDLSDRLTFGVGFRYNWDETRLAYTPSTAIGLPDMGSNFLPDATTPCSALDLAGFENADLVNCVGVRDADFEKESWNIGVTYHVSDTTLTYAKVGKGYIAGGLNDNLREVAAFDPETQLQYEVGMKSDWHLGGRPIRTNIALYHGTIKDKQIVQNASYDDSAVANGVINAAEETVQGVDIDVQFIPLRGLSIDLSYSYIDAEFDKFQFPGLGGPTGPSFVPPQDLSNEQPARVPENQFKGAISYELPINPKLGVITTSLSTYYTSSTRVRNTDITGIYGDSYITLDSYWLTNGSINWETINGSPFNVQLWIRNMFDEEYENSKDAQFNTFGYATVRYGAPRTYGLSLHYNF